ncbi:MAG: TorF family putative porin [Desulfobacterales bacterium]|nr:TorF family putative porin [Desulfobacterales bacterium]
MLIKLFYMRLPCYSDYDPAVQATIDYYNPVGIYAGVWASSWDDGGWGNDIEIGPYLGYYTTLGPVDVNVMGAYYMYPGANDDYAEWDYFEFNGDVYYTISNMPLEPTISAGYLFSPDYSEEEGFYQYFYGAIDFVLPYNFGLSCLIGHVDFDGDELYGNGQGVAGGDGWQYEHYSVGINTSLVGFGLDLTYHWTSDKEDLKAYGKKVNERFVFTLSRSI